MINNELDDLLQNMIVVLASYNLRRCVSAVNSSCMNEYSALRFHVKGLPLKKIYVSPANGRKKNLVP